MPTKDEGVGEYNSSAVRGHSVQNEVGATRSPYRFALSGKLASPARKADSEQLAADLASQYPATFE